LKICIVSPNFSGGGAERVAVNLANYYSEKGADVTIAVFRAIGPYKNSVSTKIKIFEAKVTKTWYWPFDLVPFFKANRFDLILSVIRSSNIYVGLASLFSPKSYLIFREASTMHGLSFFSTGFFKSLVFKLLIFCTYPLADKIIANSSDTQKDLIRKCFLRKKNMVVIGNPILSTKFQALAEEEIGHPWLSKKKTILAVGRLHHLKNHEMLISAFFLTKQKLKDIKLLILGEGEEKAKLLDLVISKGIEDSVDFVEFQSNPYPFYRKADLFVHTARWEGFGNVLVEAMACGVPVISTNCPGGPKEILENGKYGDLVEIDDIETLSYLMLKNLLYPNNSKIKAAKEKAFDFRIDRIAKMYIEPYVIDKSREKAHIV